MLTIPIKPLIPSQRFSVTLNGRTFVLRVFWNQRIGRWFFDLETSSGIPLLHYKGLRLGADALRQIRARGEAPPGVLTLVDTTGQKREASLASLGVEHLLIYVPDVADTKTVTPPRALVFGAAVALAQNVLSGDSVILPVSLASFANSPGTYRLTRISDSFFVDVYSTGTATGPDRVLLQSPITLAATVAAGDGTIARAI